MRSFFPFRWSKEPCDTPIIRIKNKQTKGDIIEGSILKNNKERILHDKKKIKEWLKLIFLILLLIFN